jgi:hypothetical protein
MKNVVFWDIKTHFVLHMMEALGSSETSVLTRATRRNVPEDAILHSHHRENHKSYIYFTVFSLVNAKIVPYLRRLLAGFLPQGARVRDRANSGVGTVVTRAALKQL